MLKMSVKNIATQLLLQFAMQTILFYCSFRSKLLCQKKSPRFRRFIPLRHFYNFCHNDIQFLQKWQEGVSRAFAASGPQNTN